MSQAEPSNLPVSRNIKIGLFHLGSGMADVISTGIWNRIMISDLGYAATPVGLLASLRYFLAPLSIWAGRLSDQHTLFGYRRLPWIWLGRLMMAISVVGLGVATAALMRGGGALGMAGQDASWWLVLTVMCLLFSLGGAFSGSTFLALIYDRAPEHQRSRAIGIVWTFLLVGFAVGGIAFGLLLPAHAEGEAAQFTPDTILNLFGIGALVMGALWFVSVVGEERRARAGEAARGSAQGEYSTSVMADLRLALRVPAMRFFFWYLLLSMFFAFSQDLILEPFGGQVFGMSASVTTRFTAYWALTAIATTVIFLFLARRYPRLTNTNMSYIGVAVLVGAFALFALAAFANVRQLVTPGLLLLGVGLGVWNVGTLGLMMDMSPLGKAGTFLGFWTLVVTVGRGGGVAMGGVMRDLFLGLSGNLATAYGLVFAVGVVGLLVAYLALTRAHIPAFKTEQAAPNAGTVLAGAMD